MKYYLKPGEQEELEADKLQTKRISKTLTGKKTPPEAAVIKKLKEKAMGYYDTCAFPKPQNKKKKKKCNGYKDKPKRLCHYCGTPNAERHEVYPGRGRRQICIDNGFQVDLCPACHRAMHENSTPAAQAINKFWREKYQREYEAELITSGITPGQARKLWIGLIGRSYL